MRRPANKLMVLGLLLAAGCNTGTPVTPKASASPKAPASATPGPTTVVAASPTSVPVMAPSPAAFTGRVLGLDGQPAPGVTVRGYLISDLGSSLVSNNGGGVVSNNGGRYTLQEATAPLSTKTDDKGQFTLKSPDGKPLNIEATQSDTVKAIKLGVASDLANVELKLAFTGNIAGKVTAPKAPTVTNFQGVDVYIPGTSYVAKADAGGNYTLSNVPVGSFQVVASKTGLGTASVQDVAVTSKETTSAPALALTVVAPVLTKFDPPAGGPGAKVTITGTGFGASTGELIQVSFGGAVAVDAKATDEKTLTVTVPDGAANGQVTVTIGGIPSNSLPFTVVKKVVPSVGNFLLDLGTSKDISFLVKDSAGKTIADAPVDVSVEGKGAIYKDGKLIGIETGSTTVSFVSGGVTAKLRVIVKKEATVTNLAGNGEAAHLDGPASMALLKDPWDILLDKDGNLLVLEQGGNDLRKVDLHDPAHPVTTVAGDGSGVYKDGPALTAGFNGPGGMCLGPDGTLYIADADAPHIRRLKDGVVDTLAGTGVDGFADGPGATAQFRDPHGLVYDGHDAAHPALLIADSQNHVIRRLDLADPAHTVTTVAGTPEKDGFLDGPGKTAQLHNPKLMQLDGKGGVIIADNENHRLRRLTFGATVGAVTVATLVGNGNEDFEDGTLETSMLHSPNGVTVDAAGNIYFTDADNHRVRMVTTDGYVLTIAGTGSRGFDNGPAQHNASFKGMRGIAVGPDGTIYEADSDNNTVRMIK
ncbi:MAG: hypothetical protein JWM80_3114 [Cyanobacteria bacterium RYN_339]|nr:hypothetical protein [Cyanobacteria bacterium RYN_339]